MGSEQHALSEQEFAVAGEHSFHFSTAAPHWRNQCWLSRGPVSSEHPLHRETFLHSDVRCFHNNNNNNNNNNNMITGDWAMHGIIAPAPIRPRISAGNCTQTTTNNNRISSIGKDKIVMGRYHNDNLDENNNNNNNNSSNNDYDYEKHFIGITTKRSPPPAPQLHRSNTSINSIPTTTKLHWNSSTKTISPESPLKTFPSTQQLRKSNISDDQTMQEFFSISGPDFWVDSVVSDEIISGVSSCSLGEDSIIDIDAAKSFQRRGARRARLAGPGFDEVHLYS